jgi:hypothetical protein
MFLKNVFPAFRALWAHKGIKSCKSAIKTYKFAAGEFIQGATLRLFQFKPLTNSQ